ncbi:MAG: tetraacyldisaccharide 4'-kinase [Vicinamibacterales bacterium]
MSALSDPLLDSLYARAMRVRRRWFESRPSRRRTLARPVISVGNLSMGGTGKTPVVGAIVEWLLANGERPAILSRGYARTDPVEGVVVVSDGARVLASIEQAGDEPLMLARRFPHAIVCVSPDRYLSGTLAERRLGATVHVLDDGFQHVGLARDLDVLVTTIGEIPQGRVIPRGRLREAMDAAARAHLLVVTGATAGAASAEAWALGISQSCGVERQLGAPVPLGSKVPGFPPTRPEAATTDLADQPPLKLRRSAGALAKAEALSDPARAQAGPANVRDGRVLAVAGIAHPARFAEALKDAGWEIAEVMSFPDHHRYTKADVERIERSRIAAGAGAVFTTDKDAVRFETIGPLPFSLYRVPQSLKFDPPDTLFASLRATLDRLRRDAAPHRVSAEQSGISA